MHLGQAIAPTTLETPGARGVQVARRLDHLVVAEDNIND